LLTLGPVLTASATPAPTPTCNRAEWVAIDAGTYFIPTYNGSLDCWLVEGARGASVRALQDLLVKCYGKTMPADGNFGRVTRQALMDVQRTEKIVIDGRYGPQTRKAVAGPAYRQQGNTHSPYTCVC
jgi:peptidoglycan hydrolase-like protein with peptidoglycan-binding domain